MGMLMLCLTRLGVITMKNIITADTYAKRRYTGNVAQSSDYVSAFDVKRPWNYVGDIAIAEVPD